MVGNLFQTPSATAPVRLFSVESVGDDSLAVASSASEKEKTEDDNRKDEVVRLLANSFPDRFPFDTRFDPTKTDARKLVFDALKTKPNETINVLLDKIKQKLTSDHSALINHMRQTYDKNVETNGKQICF